MTDREQDRTIVACYRWSAFGSDDAANAAVEHVRRALGDHIHRAVDTVAYGWTVSNGGLYTRNGTLTVADLLHGIEP
jgi:hypothetical protein